MVVDLTFYPNLQTCIYDKTFIIDTDSFGEAKINITIQALSYSFVKHRARYHIFFNILSSDDYGDGSLYLYEDDLSIERTQFIDSHISEKDIEHIIAIIKKDFIPNINEVPQGYILPDFSGRGNDNEF